LGESVDEISSEGAYLASDILGLVLIVVVLHAQLEFLEEGFLRIFT
jgi:hypothetical protein